MDLKEIWSIKMIVIAPPPSNIFEWNFKTDKKYKEALEEIHQALNKINHNVSWLERMLGFVSMIKNKKNDFSLFGLVDDFGLYNEIQVELIMALHHGKLSDYHRRAIDVTDTQESIALAYESTITKKTGIVGSGG